MPKKSKGYNKRKYFYCTEEIMKILGLLSNAYDMDHSQLINHLITEFAKTLNDPEIYENAIRQRDFYETNQTRKKQHGMMWEMLNAKERLKKYIRLYAHNSVISKTTVVRRFIKYQYDVFLTYPKELQEMYKEDMELYALLLNDKKTLMEYVTNVMNNEQYPRGEVKENKFGG